MNPEGPLWRQAVVSLLLHGTALCCMACLWSRQTLLMIPAFQAGEFSLELAPALPISEAESFSPSALRSPVNNTENESAANAMIRESEVSSDGLSLALDPPGGSASLPPVSSQPPLHRPNTPPAVSAISGAANPGVPGVPPLETTIRPIYPRGARLRGEEGAVTVRAVVLPSGKAQSADVLRSSGFPALDQAAVNAVRRARFVPSQRGFLPHESSQTLLTFRFTLVD